MRKRSKSYVAFNEPAIKSGQPKVVAVSKNPETNGPTAAARLRGTFVTLAAAGRSSGVTTAMT
jgi:hypothetical protein